MLKKYPDVNRKNPPGGYADPLDKERGIRGDCNYRGGNLIPETVAPLSDISLFELFFK